MWQLFSPIHPSSQRTKFFFEDILLDTEKACWDSSVRERRGMDRPATGRAGESERFLVFLFTVMLVLMLVLMFVLLLLLLVLMVVVMMVVTVFRGCRFLSEHGEWSCCCGMCTQFHRCLLLSFKIKNTQMNS